MTQNQRILALERQRMVLELRKAGLTYAQIADQVGYSSPNSAYRALQAALKEVIQEPVLELRSVQMERLNYALVKIWPKVQAGDERSIDLMLRIMEKMDRLSGTDAPTQHQVTGQVNHHVEGAVLVIQGASEDYVRGLQEMAEQAGVEVTDQQKALPPVRTSDEDVIDLEPLEAVGEEEVQAGPMGGAGRVPVLGVQDDPGTVDDEETPVCPRYVKPADVHRAAAGLCARCGYLRIHHDNNGGSNGND